MIEKAITTGRLDMLEILLKCMPVQDIKEMRNYVDLNLKITEANYKLLQNEGIKNAIDKFAENRAHITLLEENNNQLKEKIKLQIEKLSNINKDEE
jgi:cell shape-determining protein MreC